MIKKPSGKGILMRLTSAQDVALLKQVPAKLVSKHGDYFLVRIDLSTPGIPTKVKEEICQLTLPL